MGQLSAQCVARCGLCTSCSSQQTPLQGFAPQPLWPQRHPSRGGVWVSAGGHVADSEVSPRPCSAHPSISASCPGMPQPGCQGMHAVAGMVGSLTSGCSVCPACLLGSCGSSWGGCTPVGGCFATCGQPGRQAWGALTRHSVVCVCPWGADQQQGLVCFGQQLPAGVCALGRPAGVCARCAAARSSRRVLTRIRTVIGASRSC